MRHQIMFSRWGLLCASALASALPLHAQSVRTGIDVSAEAEVTKSPYLTDDDAGWVGAGLVEVRPWLVSQTETDRIELGAFARGRAFTSEYPFEDSFGGSLSASRRASARTSYFGQANILSTSARSNFSRFNRPGFGFDLTPLSPTAPQEPGAPGEPVVAPPPITSPILVSPIDDITIVGLQGRTTTMSISAGMDRQLDTVSSLNASVGYNRLWVSEDALSGYDSANINLGYTRRLSARTSIGASIGAGQSRFYSGIPKTTTLSAFVNGQHQFNDTWSVNGSIGVSNSRAEARGPFPEVDDTGIVGNVGTCRADSRSRLCLSFSRSQQPSSLGQVRTSDAIDLNFSERLSARDRVDIYANYGRSLATDDALSTLDDIEIASVGGSFTRIFTPRLEGYAFGRASRSWGGLLTNEPSLSFGVGIRARFGDRQ